MYMIVIIMSIVWQERKRQQLAPATNVTYICIMQLARGIMQLARATNLTCLLCKRLDMPLMQERPIILRSLLIVATPYQIFKCFKRSGYRVAKAHRMPYLYRSFPAKEAHNEWLFRET